MSRDKASKKSAGSKASTSDVPVKAVDPTLASLFASSAGPVQIPDRKSRNATAISARETRVPSEDIEERVDETDHDTKSPQQQDPALEVTNEEAAQPPRKRCKVRSEDDIEAQYLNKLVREEDRESRARKEKLQTATGRVATGQFSGSDHGQDEDEDAKSESSASNDLQDLSDIDEPMSEVPIPLHESLTGSDSNAEQSKRTIFISNVATSAIKSKSDRKSFISHLKSTLSAKEKERIVSVRFRSTAFDVSAGPKRAAYAKKELMDETTRSTNAYVVLSSEAAARRMAAKLNGTEILDRHIHVDSFAEPMRTDNKRCVFVGNLPFVDEETAAQDSEGQDEDENGNKKQKRSKAKLPADAEEGLWRTFSKCGKVENVRVVRDRTTRVGKGFAYVQFEDGNGVEKALLLDGKKFPPLLPRLLRVSRAKGMKRKEVRARETLRGRQVQKGRARAGDRASTGAGQKGRLNGVVFEGYRASSDNKMKFKSKGKKKEGTKPTSRSSKRGAAFKAGGGKKKRAMVR